jgi:hypothetical protein
VSCTKSPRTQEELHPLVSHLTHKPREFKPGARPSTWEIFSRASYRTFKQAVIQRDHSEVHSKLPKDNPRLTPGT